MRTRHIIRSLGLALVLGSVFPAFSTGCGDDMGEASSDATETEGRFEIFTGQDGQRYFQLLAGNGEKVLRSEGYTSLSAAKKGVQSVVTNGAKEKQYKILAAQNGEYYFNIVAKNGKVIGTSETYVSKSGATAARDRVMKLVSMASVAELPSGEAHFETFKGSDDLTYFRLRARNGQIVLQSEGYSSKSAADAGLASVRTNGTDATRYEIKKGKNGQQYFRIKAENGKIIARSEMYASKSNAERGAENVRELIELVASGDDALDAFVVDECVRGARECAFSRLESRPEGTEAVDAATARSIFEDCLSEVVLDDPDAEGANCSTTCEGAGAKLCDGVTSLVQAYASESSACLSVFAECVDYCHSEGDNWNDGVEPDLVSQTPEYQCMVDSTHDNCSKYAQAHQACGGSIAAGSDAECHAQCKAAVEPWGAGFPDEVKEYCDGQCE